MAYGDKLAVAVVFGEMETDKSADKTHVVFNKQYLPQHKLNVLLPGIETDWPDHATLSQTLIFVALPQNLRVDSYRFSGAFQGWRNLNVFTHAKFKARDFFSIARCSTIFCI